MADSRSPSASTKFFLHQSLAKGQAGGVGQALSLKFAAQRLNIIFRGGKGLPDVKLAEALAKA